MIFVKIQRIGKPIKTWVIKDIFLEDRTFELGLEQGMIVIIYRGSYKYLILYSALEFTHHFGIYYQILRGF